MNKVTNARLVAGLISTIDFTPSKYHPERVLPVATQIVAMLAWVGCDESQRGERMDADPRKEAQ